MENLFFTGIFGTLIMGILTLVIPISIYAAQKWAYRCYVELKKTNENIEVNNKILRIIGREIANKNNEFDKMDQEDYSI